MKGASCRAVYYNVYRLDDGQSAHVNSR